MIIAPGINVPFELSRPLQEIQYVGWSDRKAIKKELSRARLAASKEVIEDIVHAFEPPKIISCSYGVTGTEYTYSNIERGTLYNRLENLKELIVGNHLIGGHDPNPGDPKILRLQIERAGEKYVREVQESAVLRRSDLW